MEITPLSSASARSRSDKVVLSGEASAADRPKNLDSSSFVASEGIFPTHITHSERKGAGLGWYDFRDMGFSWGEAVMTPKPPSAGSALTWESEGTPVGCF